MICIALFDNHNTADFTPALEEIGGIISLTIDTPSADRQIISCYTETGETITREINPADISLMIDEEL